MLNPTEMLFPIHVTNSFITLFARTAFTCHVMAFLALTSSGYLFAFLFWRCTSFIVICVCMLSSCFLGDIQYILGFPFYLWTSIANICFNHWLHFLQYTKSLRQQLHKTQYGMILSRDETSHYQLFVHLNILVYMICFLSHLSQYFFETSRDNYS